MNIKPLRMNFKLVIALGTVVLNAAVYADPPSQVIRLSDTIGELSFSPSGEENWVEATKNRPLIQGDELWVAQGGKAELHLDGGVACVDELTHIDVLNITDDFVQISVYQGAFNLYLSQVREGQSFEINSPNLALTLSQPGYYQIDVSDNETSVAIDHGQAQAYGVTHAYQLTENRQYNFTGVDLDFSRQAYTRNSFDHWCHEIAHESTLAKSSRYVPPGVIGYQDLDHHGEWVKHKTYGHIWSPHRVASDWAPYRYGHWSWIEPWGWTWVDDASWGFAPYHYGRWTHWNDRWYWVPGDLNRRAYYAPALAFFISTGNLAFSIAFGSDYGNSVAWFPLGPSDYYFPSYQASRGYYQSLNRGVINYNSVKIDQYFDNSTTINNFNYANQVPDAITAATVNDFVGAKSIGQQRLRLEPDSKVTGEIQPTAGVAPKLESISGLGGETKIQPPSSKAKKIVAKQPLPESQVPFTKRQNQLNQKPGKPLPIDQLKQQDKAISVQQAGQVKPKVLPKTSPAKVQKPDKLDKSEELRQKSEPALEAPEQQKRRSIEAPKKGKPQEIAPSPQKPEVQAPKRSKPPMEQQSAPKRDTQVKDPSKAVPSAPQPKLESPKINQPGAVQPRSKQDIEKPTVKPQTVVPSTPDQAAPTPRQSAPKAVAPSAPKRHVLPQKPSKTPTIKAPKEYDVPPINLAPEDAELIEPSEDEKRQKR